MRRPNSSASLDGCGEERGRVSDHSTVSGNNLGFGIAGDLGQLRWIHFTAGFSLPPPGFPGSRSVSLLLLHSLHSNYL